MAAQARADVARTIGLADPTALSVDVESVTWSDGSLGCPMPGMVYTQALVPGWRLVVTDSARRWTYHASRSGAWVQCAAGTARPTLPGRVAR
jgi:hypothetical protein